MMIIYITCYYWCTYHGGGDRDDIRVDILYCVYIIIISNRNINIYTSCLSTLKSAHQRVLIVDSIIRCANTREEENAFGCKLHL